MEPVQTFKCVIKWPVMPISLALFLLVLLNFSFLDPCGSGSTALLFGWTLTNIWVGGRYLRGLEPGPVTHSATPWGFNKQLHRLSIGFQQLHSTQVSHRFPTATQVKHRFPTAIQVSHRFPTATQVSHRIPTDTQVSHRFPTATQVSHRFPTATQVNHWIPTAAQVSHRFPTATNYSGKAT